MSSLETYKGEGKNSALLTCITVCALAHVSQFCTIKISTRENAHKQEGVGSHGVELHTDGYEPPDTVPGPPQEQQALLTTEPSLRSTNNNFKTKLHIHFSKNPKCQKSRNLCKTTPTDSKETKVSLAALDENLSSAASVQMFVNPVS